MISDSAKCVSAQKSTLHTWHHDPFLLLLLLPTNLLQNHLLQDHLLPAHWQWVQLLPVLLPPNLLPDHLLPTYLCDHLLPAHVLWVQQLWTNLQRVQLLPALLPAPLPAGLQCRCVLPQNLLPPHVLLPAGLPSPELWLQLLPALLPPCLLSDPLLPALLLLITWPKSHCLTAKLLIPWFAIPQTNSLPNIAESQHSVTQFLLFICLFGSSWISLMACEDPSASSSCVGGSCASFLHPLYGVFVSALTLKSWPAPLSTCNLGKKTLMSFSSISAASLHDNFHNHVSFSMSSWFLSPAFFLSWSQWVVSLKRGNRTHISK